MDYFLFFGLFPYKYIIFNVSAYFSCSLYASENYQKENGVVHLVFRNPYSYTLMYIFFLFNHHPTAQQSSIKTKAKANDPK